jgi:hypothetical protein
MIEENIVTDVQEKINTFGLEMTKLLIEKNKRYGNSALQPLEIFTKHLGVINSAGINTILVRLDDKLSRVKNSDNLKKNDIIDLIGYLQLLAVGKEWTDLSDLID